MVQLITCLMIPVLGAQSPPDEIGAAPVPAVISYIDTHTHFDEKHPDAAVQAVLRAAERENAAKIYLQIPPFSYTDASRFDAEVILPAAKKFPDKIGVLGGGGILNSMILEAVSTGTAGPDVQKKFRERAEELVRAGVSGFGEMAAEHFVGSTGYEYAPPDHPLFLLLADIAAEHGVPIDIHMEAVPQAMALPPDLKSPPNAARLHENIAALGPLLSHNPRAKVIWAHMGTDSTGFRTPELCRQMLRAHPNLYMEIKFDPKLPGKNPVWANGVVKPEWLALFREFPDRIILGSDQHYSGHDEPGRWQSDVLILNQIPPDLRQKIGFENARRIFSQTMPK
jgi:predicted TIM-barrel fold metal-dependent hydrolase